VAVAGIDGVAAATLGSEAVGDGDGVTAGAVHERRSAAASNSVKERIARVCPTRPAPSGAARRR
jgi:hypothetical protein